MRQPNCNPIRFLLGVAALALLAGPLGCAENVGDIDRTQPNRVAKSLFKGVWYHQSTVIDVPQPSAITFIGETPFGMAQKIVWDIQEKQLVAYPIVETVENSEAAWKKRKIRDYWTEDKHGHLVGGFWEHEIYVGQPVAAFEIQSHFDVQRKYNEATGEQVNVIEENATDRKWYERKYIRVNWAKNLIKDYMFIARSIKTDTLDYYQQDWDETNPDRPTLSDNYIDFVVKMFAQPEIPESCDIYGVSTADCVGTVIKVRHAFRKVDKDNDYVPLWYHNKEQQDRFGFFLTERYARDPNFGYTEWGRFSYINRWNLWSKSQETKELVGDDGQPVEVPCWSTEECQAAGQGNFCQLPEWFERGHCVQRDIIPVRERYAQGYFRPIVYHLSSAYPEYLLKEAYELSDEWSRPLRDTVAWATFWDERGLLTEQRCSTNEDCNPGWLLDTEIAVKDPIPCAEDIQCADVLASSVCRDGRCVQPVACGEDNPCALGQVCYNAACYSADLVPQYADVLRGAGIRSLPAVPRTVVLYRDGGALRSLLVKGEEVPPKNSAEAHVRFVNAAPASGEAGATLHVTASGAAMGPATATVFSPTATYDTIYKAPATGIFDIEARQGETVIARRSFVNVPPGSSTLVVLAQDAGGNYDLVTSTITSAPEPRSIRVINAVPGSDSVYDIGLRGALRAGALAFRGDTGYLTVDDEPQRFTVLPAGQNGNITCFHYEGEGYCTGWKPQITDADRARVEDLKKAVPTMFVVCENQYAGDQCGEEERGDPEALNDCRNFYKTANGEWYNPCGDPQIVPEPYALKKHGDTRYSSLNWVPEAQAASPLGYGPSDADPDTGEIYYGIANIYGADMETYGTYARDLLDLVNGRLTKENIMTGDYIREYLAAQGEPATATASVASALSMDPADQPVPRAERFDLPSNLRLAMEPAPYSMRLQGPQVLEMLDVLRDEPQRQRILRETLAAQGKGSLTGDARLQRIRNTYVEDLMINNEIKVAVSRGELSPEDAVTPQWREKLSPAAWMSKAARDKERERTMRLASNNLILADFVDDQIAAWARQLGCDRPEETPITEIPEGGTIFDVIYHPGVAGTDAGGPADDTERQYCLEGEYLRLSVLARIFGGTLEHEVGHTVGLRHNFSASADVFNYQDNYYNIREREMVPCREDDWCEIGETCSDDLACAADSECPTGTVCSAARGLCVDRWDRTYGACQALQRVQRECTADADCENDLASCINSLCLVATSCEGGAPCQEGESCRPFGERALCAAANGDLRLSPLEDEVTKPLRKYVPRPWPTAGEERQHRTEYQYASLMDYGRGLNFDVHGIGKYDEAALRFGYGQLIDVYRDPSGIDRYIDKSATYYQLSPVLFSSSKDTYWWRESGVYWHPFRYLNEMIGVEANLQRDVVPYVQAKLEHRMVRSNYDRLELDFSYVEVPYKMCSDEYRGQLTQGGCYYFDLGVDIGEITYHVVDMLEEYWVFDAFKREMFERNLDGNPLGYFSRITDRWMTPLGDSGMFYALYANILRNYGWLSSWANGPMEGRTLFYASKTALQFLSQLVASPAPGSYGYDVASNTFQNLSYHTGAPGSTLDIPFGKGKLPWTTFKTDEFNWDAGYYSFRHALWIGSFWEKMAAIMTMTDSVAQFMSDYVGEQLDVGVGTSVGFNTVYQNLLTNFLGGIVAGAPEYTDGFARETNMPRACRTHGDCGGEDRCGAAGYCIMGLYPCASDADCTATQSLCRAEDDACLQAVDGRTCAVDSDRYCRRACTETAECAEGGACWDDLFCHGPAGFQPRPIFDENAPYITLARVPASIGNTTMQIYAAVYGLAYLPAAFDPSFVEALHVMIEGHGSEHDIFDETEGGVDVARFTDPFGHKTYIATTNRYEYDNPDTLPSNSAEPERLVERLPVAYRVVTEAEQLRQRWEAAEVGSAERLELQGQLREKVQLLDLLRTLSELFGDLGY